MTIQLGPFQLLQPIGKGGMGVVWRGQHVDTGVQVAVKVITQRVSRDDRSLAAFKNEVRAVAGLQHPGVVWVVDYGEVDAAAAVASEHQLIAGSPYLVMELASGGTLISHQNGMPWPSLKSVMTSLLDALAHAHARGVIHRDLKPGNVLISGPGDLRPGLKLTDFGIAHAREETVSHSMSNHVIGTLHYMAPEQIRADWRDYGPWTDLYALGTIAYRLATGSLPFKGKRGASLMVAQMNHRPPPLDPLNPMPEGFEDWLLTMVRKEHWRRFQCAADAAMALDALPDPPLATGESGGPFSLEPVPLPSDAFDEPATTLVLEATLEIAESVEPTAELTAGMQERMSDMAAARQRGELDRLRPPLPASWARNEDFPYDQLRGAGLGLWGLRSIPLVGRRRQRDALWEALREVTRSRQSRVLLVKGRKGVGKSALVQWTSERAVEIGAAHRMHCTYAADEGLDESLRRMLRRFFRVARLSPEERSQRVLDVCDTFGETDVNEAARVERLLDPVDPDQTDGGSRHAAARWLFARVASDRPLILWIDDAHHAYDALQLVAGILKSQKTSPARVLAVLTMDTDALADRPLEAAFVQSLEKQEAVSVVDVEPLSDSEMYDLLHRYLGLEPALAREVTEKAQGVPQFAVQLVGDWVARGLLQRSPRGLILPAGNDLPASIEEVWSERLGQVLEGLPDEAGVLLERAAVLGGQVEMDEWIAVGGDAAEAPFWRRVMLDRLYSMKLAVELDGGFAFLKEELRETLLDRGIERRREHEAAVAAMLASRPDTDPERLGAHLLASGQLEAGFDALLAGVRNRMVSVGPRGALPLVERLEQALMDGDVPETSVLWGRTWLVQADLAAQRGRLAPALEKVRSLEQAARHHGWDELVAMATFVEARIAMFRNETESAARLFASFEQQVTEPTVALHLAAARHARALLTGDPSEARTHAVACMEWLEQTDATLVDVWRVLGTRSLLSTRAAFLVDHLLELGRVYESDGKRVGLGEVWTMLAAAMRRSKKQDEAVLALENALRLYRVAESDEAQRAQLQLAILKLGRGDVEGARLLAGEVVEETSRQRHRKPIALRAHATMAACTASHGEWSQVREHLTSAAVLASETGVVEREVAWCLGRAGELARRADRSDQALAAWELALEQYRGLGDEGQVRRLKTLIQRES